MERNVLEADEPQVKTQMAFTKRQQDAEKNQQKTKRKNLNHKLEKQYQTRP